ncbi:hypothetical protein J6590_064539 [Homalodisca vitripennis]|nr:hypothetical protein J6590_064539 [Homalodisca vitripennis]
MKVSKRRGKEIAFQKCTQVGKGGPLSESFTPETFIRRDQRVKIHLVDQTTVSSLIYAESRLANCLTRSNSSLVRDTVRVVFASRISLLQARTSSRLGEDKKTKQKSFLFVDQ